MTNMIDTITRAKGTIYYLAPESLEVADLTEEKEIISKITTKVDVWAFGCVVSYIYSGVLPWGDSMRCNDNIHRIQKLLLNKKEFPVPETNIKEQKYKNEEIIINIIKESTRIEIDKRPSIKDLLENFLLNLK